MTQVAHLPELVDSVIHRLQPNQTSQINRLQTARENRRGSTRLRGGGPIWEMWIGEGIRVARRWSWPGQHGTKNRHVVSNVEGSAGTSRSSRRGYHSNRRPAQEAEAQGLTGAGAGAGGPDPRRRRARQAGNRGARSCSSPARRGRRQRAGGGRRGGRGSPGDADAGGPREQDKVAIEMRGRG